MQIAGIGWGDRDHLFGNVGLNIMRTLSYTQSLRFYALAGASIFYTGNKHQQWGPCTDPYSACEPIASQWNNETALNFGAGIGLEMIVARDKSEGSRRKLGIAVELPLTVMISPTNEYGSFRGVYPIPSAAMVYYF